MEIVVLKQAQKELKAAPKDVLEDVFSLFADLAMGKKLGMPISRPLPGLAKGLSELRLSGKAGEYRVFYVIKVGDAVYIIHATDKKTQIISKATTALLRARLRRIDRE